MRGKTEDVFKGVIADIGGNLHISDKFIENINFGNFTNLILSDDRHFAAVEIEKMYLSKITKSALRLIVFVVLLIIGNIILGFIARIISKNLPLSKSILDRVTGGIFGVCIVISVVFAVCFGG